MGDGGASGGGMDSCDLVLGGGGVRGVAHVGALAALGERGLPPRRIAGASAGAMAGAVAVAGATPEQMLEYLTELDWRGFALADVVGRMARRPLVGGVMARLGSPATVDPLQWLEGLLSEHGVHTWADLRDDDAEDWVPEHERYRLVVRCLDVVNHRVVRLPWDYARYGLDPDEQSVAEAVRASMSVPLVFDPVPIGDRDDGGGLLVDGGIGSGFAVGVFDRVDGRPPVRPTFGVQLVPRQRSSDWPSSDLALVRSVIETMLDAGNAMEPVGRCDEERTIRVDTTGIASMDVGMSQESAQELFEAGFGAVQDFLDRFDVEAHLRDCRGARDVGARR